MAPEFNHPGRGRATQKSDRNAPNGHTFDEVPNEPRNGSCGAQVQVNFASVQGCGFKRLQPADGSHSAANPFWTIQSCVRELLAR